jgi:hypothetical protein
MSYLQKPEKITAESNLAWVLSENKRYRDLRETFFIADRGLLTA